MENMQHVVSDYFKSLNPIARRVCEDVDSTRENYESAWDHLSLDEQHQVVDESLIHPAAVLKYHLKEADRPASHAQSFPVLKLNFGAKVVEDETGMMWRDEHSAPFTWKSASQLDLSGIVDAQTLPAGQLSPSKDPKQKRPAGPPPLPPPKFKAASDPQVVEQDGVSYSSPSEEAPNDEGEEESSFDEVDFAKGEVETARFDDSHQDKESREGETVHDDDSLYSQVCIDDSISST